MLAPDLFGRTFGGDTFANWRAVAKMLDGLPLSESEFAFWREISGRTDPPPRPFTVRETNSGALRVRPSRFASAQAFSRALLEHSTGSRATALRLSSSRIPESRRGSSLFLESIIHKSLLNRDERT
jgi:hypothetical protein